MFVWQLHEDLTAYESKAALHQQPLICKQRRRLKFNLYNIPQRIIIILGSCQQHLAYKEINFVSLLSTPMHQAIISAIDESYFILYKMNVFIFHIFLIFPVWPSVCIKSQ